MKAALLLLTIMVSFPVAASRECYWSGNIWVCDGGNAPASECYWSGNLWVCD